MSSGYVDRTAAAVEYCESMANTNPVFSQFAKFTREKLWHQLTTTILEYMSSSQTSENNNKEHFTDLYHKVVLAVDTKLHALSYARIAVLTAFSVSEDLTTAKSILENCQEKLAQTDNSQAVMYLQSKLALLQLQQFLKIPGFHLDTTASEEDKDVLERIHHQILHVNAPIVKESTELAAQNPDAALVQAAHYQVCMTYYKLLGPPEAFYEQAMQYLNFAATTSTTATGSATTKATTTEQENDVTDPQFAVDLCLAAMTGDGVYNLTAVVEQPVVQALANIPQYAWLYELLQALASGNILLFQRLVSLYAAQIAAQPALVHRAAVLQEKLTLTALVLAVLKLDSHERNLPLDVLVNALHLDEMSSGNTKDSIEQVEWVLMRAFSVGLLQGTIDQCAQTVDIQYVQPRVLDKQHMNLLASKFGDWAERVGATHATMKDQTSATLLA